MDSDCNLSEAQHSVSDSENQAQKPLPEKLFAEIIESLEEYTTEKAEILLLNKSKLLSVLKTHRALKICDYQYGLTTNLLKNRTLIVFEWENKKMVRQYYKHWGVNMWRCLSCENLYKHQLRSTRFHIYVVNGIVFIPVGHDCPPRDYELVMQYQKFLEEGNVPLAKRMSHMVSFTYGESSIANIVNAIGRIENDKTVSKASDNLKRKSTDDNRTSASAAYPSANKKIKTSNDKKNFICDEPGPSANQKCKTNVNDATTRISATTYSFVKPSISKLQKICSKLEIKFCKEAMKFWKEIVFKEINPSSTNIVTQNYKEKNFYKILSNFFTGKFSNYEQIYLTINTALRDKLIVDGNMSFEEIDILCSSFTVTERHLKFIAKFLPCRILIFDTNENEVKKYGKWKDTENINVLTLVLSLSKRKYSVVLNL